MSHPTTSVDRIGQYSQRMTRLFICVAIQTPVFLPMYFTSGAWVFLLGRDPAGTAAGRVAAAFVWADIGVSELRSGEHHT